MSVIGIDIDGVMADYVDGIIATSARHHLPINVRRGAQPHVFDLVDAGWFSSCDDFWTAHNILMTHQKHIPPLVAPSVLHPLKHRGHTIIAVTARGEYDEEVPVQHEIRKQTCDWIHHHIAGIDDIVFEAHKSRAGVDVLIDDYPPNVQDIVDAHARGIMISQSYNRDYVSSFEHYSSLGDAIQCLSHSLE